MFRPTLVHISNCTIFKREDPDLSEAILFCLQQLHGIKAGYSPQDGCS